jgi:3-hydroxyisobutyrate dehydrogenase-like beta-hydroxyacid dehydrogenase
MQRNNSSVGVIGLGIMGSAMATNLQKSGFSVVGSDPRVSQRRLMKARITTASADNAEVLAHSRLIITSLPSGKALFSVAEELAQAVAAKPRRSKGAAAIVAETSTLSLEDKLHARELFAKGGIEMLDCPLSGTGAQAQNRDLTVFASGSPSDIKAFMPVFRGFSKTQFNVGAFGNGIKTKWVANLLVAIHNISTAEALLFARELGLDMRNIVEVLADGAGSSRMLQIRGPMMVKHDWQPATMRVGIWKKDMTIIQSVVQALNVPAPLFQASLPVYAAAMAQGLEDDDTAAVFEVLEGLTGKVARRTKVSRKTPARSGETSPSRSPRGGRKST